MHYLSGKADWMIRGLPCDPPPPLGEKLHALPYFVNNLFPGLRQTWISISRRSTVAELCKDDLPRLTPSTPLNEVTESSAHNQVVAVVLDAAGVLLGSIEAKAKGARAIDPIILAMNPAPQTIRPDMTHRLAAKLLEKHPYILVTTSFGKYLGRYDRPLT